MSEESNLSDVTSPESSITNYDTDDTVRTSSTRPIDTTKKSVVLTDDESVLKFTHGEPIIDQCNPFKKNNNRSNDRKSTTPTKIPKLKKEQYKNAVNALKKSSSDDQITTEEVLRQSKYVKTYIKNPDPYFVYDPAILQRIREEELKRKEQIIAANKENIKALRNKLTTERLTKEVKTPPKSKIPYKKCSKPNYPDLSDIKVKVGTDTDGSYFNPTEVKTNAKKFDECVKKKRFNFDDDSEDMEENLPKSSSNEEEDDTTKNNQNETHSTNQKTSNNDGSFTNTINSKDFQQYLSKKGLVLAPQQLVNEAKATTIYAAPLKPSRTNVHVVKPSEQRSQNQRALYTQPDTDSFESPKKAKKSSLIQRLLANNIFSAKRKTTPKEPVPKPRSVYNTDGSKVQFRENQRQIPLNRRILLQREIDNPSGSRLSNCNNLNKPMIECDTVDGPTPKLLPKTVNTPQLKRMNVNDIFPNEKIIGTPSRKNHQSAQVQKISPSGTSTMDRNQIQRRSMLGAPLRTLQVFNASPSRLPTQAIPSGTAFEQQGPKTTSTPIRPRSSTDYHPQRFASSSTISSSLYDDAAYTNPNISKSDWLRLREQQQIQLSTDRELYTNVLNQKPRNNENLYERLPIRHILVDQVATQPIYSSLDQQNSYFVRGGQQRNTFCGSNRDPNYKNYNKIVPAQPEHTQSEHNFQLGDVNVQKRNQPSRLSTNTLSREEIIEKVKQFCRNSMRKKAEKQAEQKRESIAEMSSAGTDISPVTYATVGSQPLRPAGRKPSPQVPPRMQSLKRNPEPATNSSPIPIYVNYEKDITQPLHQQGVLQNQGAENSSYITVDRRGREGLVTSPQFVSNTIMENAGRIAHRRSSYDNSRSIMRHLAKPPRQSQQVELRAQNYGRDTPLILERSQNLQSQIYRPRYREAMPQQNLDDRLLIQRNLRSRQIISGSLNFQPIGNVEQTDDGHLRWQQNTSDGAENKQRYHNEGHLHSSKTA